MYNHLYNKIINYKIDVIYKNMKFAILSMLRCNNTYLIVIKMQKYSCDFFEVKVSISFQNRGKSTHNISKEGKKYPSVMYFYS